MFRIVPVVIYLVLILWQSNNMVHKLLERTDERIAQQEYIETLEGVK